MRRLPALAFVFVLIGGLSRAQNVTATLVGTVTDQTGAIVDNATVTVVQPAKDVTRTAQTDASGNYSFPLLPPGTYRLSVEKQGFRRAEFRISPCK